MARTGPALGTSAFPPLAEITDPAGPLARPRNGGQALAWVIRGG